MKAYPTDGAFPFYLADVLLTGGDLTGAVKALDASLARDRGFAFAWRMKPGPSSELVRSMLPPRRDEAAFRRMFARLAKGGPRASRISAPCRRTKGNARTSFATMRRLIPLVPAAGDPVHPACERAWRGAESPWRQFVSLWSNPGIASPPPCGAGYSLCARGRPCPRHPRRRLRAAAERQYLKRARPSVSARRFRMMA